MGVSSQLVIISGVTKFISQVTEVRVNHHSLVSLVIKLSQVCQSQKYIVIRDIDMIKQAGCKAAADNWYLYSKD